MKDGKIYSLHISDIHFGKKDDLRLFRELGQFNKKIHKEGEDIDIVFLQGDLYDRILKFNEIGGKLVLEFITELCELSDKYDFELRIIKGTKTHDFNQLDVFKKFEGKHKNFRIITTVEVEEIFEDIYVLYLPEEYPENPEEYYAEYFNIEGKYDYIIGHGMIDFVAHVPEKAEDTGERFVRNAVTLKAKQLADLCYGLISFGHIHDRCDWKKKIYYTGSYSAFAFGEKKSKGYLECYYDPEELTFRVKHLVNKEAPSYITVNIDEIHFESTEEKITFIKDLKDEYDFIKIKTNNDAENVDILKQVVAADNDVKIDIKRNVVDEDKVDEKYLFIIRREYDLPTTLQKYMFLKYGKMIELDIINDVIGEIKE